MECLTLNYVLRSVRVIANECDCRAEHGAEGAPHLRAIRDMLLDVLHTVETAENATAEPLKLKKVQPYDNLY